MRNFQWNKSKDGVWRGHLVRYPLVAEARIKPHREGFWFEVSARYKASPVRAVCGFRRSVVEARNACKSPPVYGFWGGAMKRHVVALSGGKELEAPAKPMKPAKLKSTDMVVTMSEEDFSRLTALLAAEPKLLERVKARARRLSAGEYMMAEMMGPPPK